MGWDPNSRKLSVHKINVNNFLNKTEIVIEIF